MPKLMNPIAGTVTGLFLFGVLYAATQAFGLQNAVLVDLFGFRLNAANVVLLVLAAAAVAVALSARRGEPGRGWWAELALTALITTLCLYAPLSIYPVFLMQVLCFALFACAFNVLIGYVGLLSFGHAAYFGGAAYICAHLVKVGTVTVPFLGTFQAGPVTPEIGILAGTLFGGLLGLLFGSLAIRRQGIYFSMITLALAEMFFLFCVQVPFTHNEDGIQSVPRTRLFGLIETTSETTLYYIVLAVFLIGFGIIYRTIHSPFGQVLKAIRENEPRAISLGYDVERFKLLAFVLSCAIAGMAGATKSLVFRLASLTDVTWQMSGEVVLMTLVGGIGTIFGPVLGATIIVGMQNYLAELGEWVLVIQGVIFVACVMLFRRGIVGEIIEALRQRTVTKVAASSPTAPAAVAERAPAHA